MVPALAVADALRAEGCEVTFVGGERAEAQLVPAAGYELRPIRVRGLSRTNPVEAAKAAAPGGRGAARGAPRSCATCAPPRCSARAATWPGPVGLAAAARRVPLVLSEADSHLGITNRMLAPFAKRVCLAFPIEGRAGDRYLVTGRPVPPPATDRVAARERFGLGAGRHAACSSSAARSARARSTRPRSRRSLDAPYRVLHAAGERDMPRCARACPRTATTCALHRSTSARRSLASDLCVARSGGSIFEVAAHGRPAILVPYPHATGDHQTPTPGGWPSAGAAVVLADDELTPQRLRAEVDALLADPARLAAMAQASAGLARPDAAARRRRRRPRRRSAR